MSDKDELSEIRRTNIMVIIENLGISKQELADKIGINRQTLANCLKEDRTVSNRTVDKIYDAFPELDIDSLDEPGFDPSKKKRLAPVVINQDVMVTLNFPGKPIAIPLTFDEARELLLSLLE